MATMIGMTAEQAAEAGKSLTFEKVWAAMDRYSEEADKRQAEADKRFQELEKTLKETSEQMKETDRAMKETDRLVKETAEQMKVTDMRLDKLTQNVDKLTERVDKVVERVDKVVERVDKVVERVDKVTERVDKVTQNVGKLGNTLGMLIETLVAARLWEKFKIYGLERAYQRVPIYNENKRTVSEIDILLSNTDCAIAVEVKMNPDKGDVDWHIKRMGFIQDYPPAEIAINNKRVMGAVAGGIVAPDVVDYAHECGFFVIELTGESAQLVPPPAGFTPKIWREKG